MPIYTYVLRHRLWIIQPYLDGLEIVKNFLVPVVESNRPADYLIDIDDLRSQNPNSVYRGFRLFVQGISTHQDREPTNFEHAVVFRWFVCEFSITVAVR